MVKIINPETKEVFDFYIEKKLIPFLENIKKNLSQKDKDYVMAITGHEGAGKSTLAMQLSRFIDPALNLSRICMTSKEFIEAVQTSKPNSAIIYDEAVTGLTSAGSISKIGKVLRSMMMQMRQKNLFVIIIIPAIFELNKYSILYRTNSLFHVYERDGLRGYWVGYNRKDIKRLYLKGRKTYSYNIRSNFIGRFYGKYVINEEGYRKKKEEALFQVDDEDKPVGKDLHKTIIGLYLDDKTTKEIEEIIKKWKMPLSLRQVQSVIEKYRNKEGI